jgi:diguanylate cyclase (GGDEF)-like protein
MITILAIPQCIIYGGRDKTSSVPIVWRHTVSSGLPLMHLDIVTLTAMGSFVSGFAGAILIFAWLQNRKTPSLALWGLAHIVYASGIACLMLGNALHQPTWAAPGFILLVLAPGLVWKAARTFDAKPAPLIVAMAGALGAGLLSRAPGMHAVAGSLGLATSAAYLFSAAASSWFSRIEPLAARWPLIILMALHGTILMFGAYGTLSGAIVEGEIPALMSVFGLVHFESIIYSIGTSVCILAMVRERHQVAREKAARIDPLSGVANRAAFMESAALIVEQCRRESAPVSVMMCDLDWFKAVNDTHGHAVGDVVIRKFCEVASGAIRPDDMVGRIGGEEFAIILPRASIEAAYVRAERIRASFAESCRSVEGNRVNATVSCGVSASAAADLSLETLLRYADVALYRAKHEGRNRVKRVEPSEAKAVSPVIRVA